LKNIAEEQNETSIREDKILYCFFNTPKRHSILLEAIANSYLNPSSKSLKRLCATRWVERYTAVNDFVELFSCVVEALEEISTHLMTNHQLMPICY